MTWRATSAGPYVKELHACGASLIVTCRSSNAELDALPGRGRTAHGHTVCRCSPRLVSHGVPFSPQHLNCASRFVPDETNANPLVPETTATCQLLCHWELK